MRHVNTTHTHHCNTLQHTVTHCNTGHVKETFTPVKEGVVKSTSGAVHDKVVVVEVRAQFLGLHELVPFMPARRKSL